MANTNNTERVVVEALGAWLSSVGNATPYLMGLAAVTTEWSEPNARRVYPEAEIEQVSWDVEEFPPFQAEGATGVTAGKACLCYGRFSSKLKLDFWCQGRGQRSVIEEAIHRALHAEAGRGGLWLPTAAYYGEPVSYTLVSKERLDNSDDVQKGVFRLVVTVEAETALLSSDVSAPITGIDPRFIVDNDPTNTALVAAALTTNPAYPVETQPVAGEPVVAPFTSL